MTLFSFVYSSRLCIFLLVTVLLRTHDSYLIRRVLSFYFDVRMRGGGGSAAFSFPFLSQSRSRRFLPAHTHSHIYVSDFLFFIFVEFVSFCI